MGKPDEFDKLLREMISAHNGYMKYGDVGYNVINAKDNYYAARLRVVEHVQRLEQDNTFLRRQLTVVGPMVQDDMRRRIADLESQLLEHKPGQW